VRVLLDAHAFLWWASTRGSRLSERARELVADGGTDVLVGAGVLYEIGIKAEIGRLDLPGPPDTYLPRLLRRFAFGVLPISEEHALRAAVLPMIHRDPWDRLLIAQAQIESMAIVTVDPAIAQYDVETIW
jgi:PIN domain nuclease of toxin-antitoxin system